MWQTRQRQIIDALPPLSMEQNTQLTTLFIKRPTQARWAA